MIKIVIFDLDDTLYPEIEYAYSGFEEVANAMTDKYLIGIKKDELIELFNIDKRDVYKRLLLKRDINYCEADIKTFVEIYRNHYPKKDSIHLYKGTYEILEYLKRKYKIGLITDGRIVAQNNKIDALGIRKFFDKIIITSELGDGYCKPHPKAFIDMKEAFNVNWDEMVYIGDNRTKDFIISKYYPIKTIEILHKNKIHNSTEYNDKIKPKYLVYDIIDVIDIIKEL